MDRGRVGGRAGGEGGEVSVGNRVTDKPSEALKAWNRQARSRAREGRCAAINCRAAVPKGKAWCEVHK